MSELLLSELQGEVPGLQEEEEGGGQGQQGHKLTPPGGGGAELGHCTQIAHREKRTSQHRLYTNSSLKVALSQTVNFQKTRRHSAGRIMSRSHHGNSLEILPRVLSLWLHISTTHFLLK